MGTTGRLDGQGAMAALEAQEGEGLMLAGGATLGSMASLGCPWRARDDGLSTALGAAVIVIGVAAATSLCWLSLRLLAAKPRVATQLLLLQLCSAALVCCVLAGFPFTGTSAVAGHWLFGARGCTARAAVHHMGVVAQLWTLAALALERWLRTRAAPAAAAPPPPAHWYARALALPWLIGAAVAVPPLLAWGSFGCDASGVWCSVNWGGGGSPSYVVFALLAGRLVPAAVTVGCLCSTGAAAAAAEAGVGPVSDGPHHGLHSCSAVRRAHASLTAVARLTAAGILVLRAPRLLLDLYLAVGASPWNRAPVPLVYLAPVADEASALVLPLVCTAVDRWRRDASRGASSASSCWIQRCWGSCCCSPRAASRPPGAPSSPLPP